MEGVSLRSGGEGREMNGVGGQEKGGQGYRDLVVWQKAIDLVASVYQATGNWPREEQFGGLTSQVRRAAVSIPSNIAEGHGRTGPREFAHHVSIAFGSLCELETQLLIAERLGYLSTQRVEPVMAAIADVRRLLRGLLRSLRERTSTTDFTP